MRIRTEQGYWTECFDGRDYSTNCTPVVRKPSLIVRVSSDISTFDDIFVTLSCIRVCLYYAEQSFKCVMSMNIK